ncbi:ferritin ribonucleotide reductase [Trichoderma arundinaceum]|uniref:Ferritin ribonucleotide reductase n=1 Tax=Trichoderma arundinaceum TaxID=490622 RepID=A0A395NCJ2_TRIAR|nr:ferritin ribonucleotide reductase [Trichoderma arundinaceum]
MRLLKPIVALSSVAGVTTATPLGQRQFPAITDADILNYALTLEHLEDNFYREGLANFTAAQFAAAGYDASFYHNLREVSSDETAHVKFLTQALTAAGATPVAECTYAFGVTSVDAFVATAAILEGVGVSAYLGAAADIINKDYLTAAGSILTVESRHSAYLRSSLKESPFAQPFDAPLSINNVYTLAAGFITACPSSNPVLPVKAFPSLTVDPKTPKPIKAGSTVTLLTSGDTMYPREKTFYAAFISVAGPTFVVATPAGDGFCVTIPKGFSGQTYAVLTTCNETVTDDTTAAGPAIIEITE